MGELLCCPPPYPSLFRLYYEPLLWFMVAKYLNYVMKSLLLSLVLSIFQVLEFPYEHYLECQ